MTTRRRLLLCVVLAAGSATAPAAGAAGPPVPSPDSGRAGAVAPGGSERLVTRRASAATVISARSLSDGRVLRTGRIRGNWTVPAVTINNDTTGLSADGRTLVLVRPFAKGFPARTPLAVIDAQSLQVRRTINLPGFFTVDAISPDGRWVYAIQYEGDNVLDYRVRALDTQTGRLAARDVVDPRAPDEQMGGLPFVRTVSPDGRWAYTLYGGGEETFIHALDTVGRTAACVDLDMLPRDGDLSAIKLDLSADGRRLEVVDGSELKASVDARTFAVTEPHAAAAATPTPQRRAAAPVPSGGDISWPIPALAVVAAASVLALLAARRMLARRPA